jgi:hypothetical protein
VGLDVWRDSQGRQVLEQAVRGVAEARRALLTGYPTGDSWVMKAWRRAKATRTMLVDDEFAVKSTSHD